MANKTTNIIAGILLATMGFLALTSYLEDSATMDELSHIPAGYSYLSQKDFRINPEHPPLIKDLAALPLLFLNLNFPKDSPAWTEGVNNQWLYGWEFLYNSGNNLDQIIFWARLPMVLLLVALGWFLFWWTKKEFGKKIALLTLTFFSFSPNFLAHGRLVTTDVGAVLGVIVSTYFWLKFLRKPSKKNVFLAGLILGFSLLLKFSVVLLIPFFGIITIVYSVLKKENILKYVGLSILAGIIGTIFVIMPVYQFHVLNYPPEKQLSDTIFNLESSLIKPLKDFAVWAADKPIVRTISYYLSGLLMATHRTIFGNTVYFLNMISNSAWWYYFPVVYFLKIPLGFHVLTLISLVLVFLNLKRPFWIETKKRIRGWILNHFTEFSMLVFLAIYWGISIAGNLNLGIRHILPVFPFTYILVSLGLNLGISKIKTPALKKAGGLTIMILVLWYVLSSLNAFPYYLSYFNEIGGGYQNGYKYVVDSNYDWGQDLKRLARWIEANNIEKIKIDYFGGGDVNHYLGSKAEKFNPFEDSRKGWIAVSATLLQSGRGNPIRGFIHASGYYKWLDDYEPVARAGTSIFIYYID